jgi:hypothetical protein
MSRTVMIHLAWGKGVQAEEEAGAFGNPLKAKFAEQPFLTPQSFRALGGCNG